MVYCFWDQGTGEVKTVDCMLCPAQVFKKRVILSEVEFSVFAGEKVCDLSCLCTRWYASLKCAQPIPLASYSLLALNRPHWLPEQRSHGCIYRRLSAQQASRLSKPHKDTGTPAGRPADCRGKQVRFQYRHWITADIEDDKKDRQRDAAYRKV